jgi:hypothetical protein
VLVRFVQYLEALRRESLGQLLCDEIGSPHVARLGEGSLSVNGPGTQSSLEGVTRKSA